MIRGISNTIAGFEQLHITGCLAEGQADVAFTVERANLDAGQQTTYDEFLALGNAKAFTNIDNTVCMMSFDRITAVALTEDTEELDYDTMGAPDQAKVDAFIQLVDDLT